MAEENVRHWCFFGLITLAMRIINSWYIKTDTIRFIIYSSLDVKKNMQSVQRMIKCGKFI